MLVVIGGAIVLNALRSAVDAPTVVAAVFLVALGAGLIAGALGIEGDRRDLRGGRVAVVAGPAVTSSRQSLDAPGAVCYLELADYRFAISEELYLRIGEGERYRAYFLPRTKVLVNIEPE